MQQQLFENGPVAIIMFLFGVVQKGKQIFSPKEQWTLSSSTDSIEIVIHITVIF